MVEEMLRVTSSSCRLPKKVLTYSRMVLVRLLSGVYTITFVLAIFKLTTFGEPSSSTSYLASDVDAVG